MSSDTYKASKEAFVADGAGSSITHVNLMSIPAVVSLALYAILRARLPPLSRTQLFALSFTTLVVPLLLALTLFSHAPVLYSTSLLCLTLVASLLPKRESGTPLPSLGSPLLSPASSPGRIGGGQGTGQEMSNEGRRSDDIPALTVYRAHMLLMTALCILAVDFPIFPRMLAKCETWGASLMDIGVGSFVFSQGLAVAHPIVRNPSYLNAPLRPKLVRATRKALPVLALGLVRVLLVKGTDYPEHVTEYGVHWNFFLTLGLLPIMQTLFHPIIASDVISIPTLGILIALAHQLVLTFYLQDYVLDSQRNGLFGMNKEGVVSLPGYLALHILGLACGTAVLPPSPSAFRRMRLKKKSVDGRESEKKSNERERKDKVQGAYRENDKTATVLFSWSCIYWSLLGLCTLLGFGSAISRRMANAPYILWTAAYNTTFLLAYVLLDLVLFPSPLSASVYDPVSHLKVRARVASMTGTANNAPALLVAINRSGLAFFLVANLATGAVNLTMRTMYADDTTAMGVLGVYAAVICAFAWATKDRRLL